MTSNYRVMKFVDSASGETFHAIHEVYYDGGGKPVAFA